MTVGQGTPLMGDFGLKIPSLFLSNSSSLLYFLSCQNNNVVFYPCSCLVTFILLLAGLGFLPLLVLLVVLVVLVVLRLVVAVVVLVVLVVAVAPLPPSLAARGGRPQRVLLFSKVNAAGTVPFACFLRMNDSEPLNIKR